MLGLLMLCAFDSSSCLQAGSQCTFVSCMFYLEIDKSFCDCVPFLTGPASLCDHTCMFDVEAVLK